MNADKNNENLDELISSTIGRDKPQFDFDKWRQNHRSEIETFKSQTAEQKERPVRILKTGRIIVKNPVTKIAAAAVIIITCFTGLHFWKSTGSGIALADVLTRLEQVTAYMYQMNITRTGRINIESTSTVLVSREHGIKAVYIKADPNKGDIAISDSYLLPRKKSIIFVNHEEKNYTLIKYEEGEIDYYKDEYNEPHTIIKQFLACNHISIGQSVIEGVTVEGFQTTDLDYKGGFFGQDDYFVGGYKKVDVKLWVDVKTFLPVRLEEDVVTAKGSHIHQICYDFRWNVIVNEADFEPNIPDDYTSPIGDFIIPVNNEETTVKGLKLYNNLAGHYPVSLETDRLLGEANKLMNFEGPDSLKGLSEDEKTRKTSEFILLMMPEDFYGEMVENNMEPAYYGEKVGSNDSDKILLRWKLNEGQYRVIFGDLSIKNITAEELAELEKP